MVAELKNECISLSVLPVGRVHFPAVAEYFKGFSLADHTLSTLPKSVWQKIAQSPLNGTTQPVGTEEALRTDIG